MFPTLCNEICGYFQFCPLPSACTKEQLTQKLNIDQIHKEFQGLAEKTALHESPHPFLTQQLCDLICGQFVTTQKT